MIAIRPYRAEDWPSLCAVHDAARPDELKGSCDPRAFVPLEEDPEAEELRRCTIFVAVDGSDVVGFAGVDGDYLGWLYVRPDYYRQGIGRRLLRAALEEVSGEAWTIVLAGNEPAIDLYRGEGFREVARFESENAGYPCTCVRMVRRPVKVKGDVS